VLIERTLRAAVTEAFAMALPMRLPDSPQGGVDDGFGAWLPIFAALVTQCGLTPQAALALRVDRAFALLAAHRRNQGWEVAGTPYALREVAEEPEGSSAEAGPSPSMSATADQPSTINP
jgi:hypothetical protein